jgi:hypothetical protein
MPHLREEYHFVHMEAIPGGTGRVLGQTRLSVPVPLTKRLETG